VFFLVKNFIEDFSAIHKLSGRYFVIIEFVFPEIEFTLILNDSAPKGVIISAKGKLYIKSAISILIILKLLNIYAANPMTIFSNHRTKVTLSGSEKMHV
jgi:hypothetical protein